MQIIATVSVNVRLITLKPNREIPAADFFLGLFYMLYMYFAAILLFNCSVQNNLDPQCRLNTCTGERKATW